MTDDTTNERVTGAPVVETETHRAPDGTALSIRTFRPPVSEADPVPVLLQRTPYGKPEELFDGSLAARALADGYAVAFEDTRGRGESDGEFLPWVHEGEDGAATVEWLADRPWSTGQVGCFGSSSAGQVQLFAAAQRPDGLAAIAPTFTPSDLHRCDFFQDGAMSAMTLITWSLGWVAGDTLDRLVDRAEVDSQTADRIEEVLASALEDVPALASHRPLVDLPADVLADARLPDGTGVDDVIPHWDAWTSRPTYDEFWRSFDPELDYDRIEVPALHVTGWYELCQQGTLTNFAGLRDRSPAPQHLVVGPWAHLDTSGELGDLDFGATASADEYGVTDLQLAFFDAYVRGRPRAPFAAADPGAGGDSNGNDDPTPNRFVETFRTTVADGEAGGRWIETGDWPPADARTERWFLHGDGDAATDPDAGSLSRVRPEKFGPPDEWTHDPTDPVPTRGGPLCCRDETEAPGPVDQRPVEARDDVCTFTTAPFDRPVDLAGPVRASLTVATSAPDADVTVKLVHVTADGPAYNLCEGIRRLQYRYGRDRSVPVTPGEPTRVSIDAWDVHHRIPAGDRLRLEVASSNAPRFDPHPGTVDPWTADAEAVRTAEQTLFHEFDRESTLTITRTN